MRSLLIKGLCKRVGTGDTILVFKDPWLPRPATFRPYCSTLDNPNVLVRDLINESRSGWNMQMVRELFNLADQQSICSLPISKFLKADSWMWHYTADGTYSVKSGYFVASQLDQFDPSPSKSWFAVWWKVFWKTSLPKKVLIFAWRGFHDALPTYVGLQKRKVVDHTNCPICGFSVDSNSHVVFLCRGFKKNWKELRVTMLNNLSMDISFKQIVLKASEILSRSDYELFLIAAWYIWSERNQIIHGRKANPSDVVVSQIFNQCSRHNIMAKGSTCLSPERWVKPPLGAYKLNVDASLDVNSNTIGIGAIIGGRGVVVLGLWLDQRETFPSDSQPSTVIGVVLKFKPLQPHHHQLPYTAAAATSAVVVVSLLR
ncbi:hypothetical protein F8388_016489 [Cannabis sativa]|uniref:Reverse transcriptase zinc-binding domain-containing protein n=1 Tax=Cannabis sativa TaxID=3483 RepID=A0A7J6EQK5_CANSA|nr:hypothetical protein F8388_016489 [Cannabis sativa]